MEYFNIDNYMENLISRCKEAFGNRLVYVGLQGSYLRGEATENSDIDVMGVGRAVFEGRKLNCGMANIIKKQNHLCSIIIS